MKTRRYVRTVVYLTFIGIALLYTTAVIAEPNGIAGFSGASGSTCTVCHGQSGTVSVSINAVSGTTVAPGSVASFELFISGGPAVEAGLDIAASDGTLVVTAAGTRILNGELVHTSQTPSMSGGSATIPFDWQAPTTPGTYTLNAAGMSTNGNGGTSGDATGTTSMQITVAQPANQTPTAVISGPTTGEAGVAVDFNGGNSSDPDGNIVDYAWDFGDSSGANGVQVSHAFAAGTYTVTLTVTDNNGATDTASTQIQITATNVAPVAAISGPSNGTEGVAVTFDGSGSSDSDGSVVAYSWDFGDGTAGASAIVTHTYAAGNFTVTLMVTDNDGAVDHATLNINIVPAANPQPPVANAGGPYNGTEGIAIQFDGSASNDPDGSVVAYDWDFGDGNTGTGVGPVHIYDMAGSYTVQLIVTDDSGDTGSSQTTADIVAANPPPQAPVADAGGPYNGTVDVAVQFDGSGSTDPDGSVVAYEWDFGDGNTGSGVNPSHTYTAPGTYTVQLTVTDDSGDADSSQTTAVVVEPDTTPPDPPAETDGEALYNTYCASCHGAKGTYRFYKDVAGEDAGDIREAIEEEKEMAFLGNILSQADINAIAAYINGKTPPDGDDDGSTAPPPDKDDDDGHKDSGQKADDDEKSDMSHANPFVDQDSEERNKLTKEELGTGALHWFVLLLATILFVRRRMAGIE